MMGAFVIIPPFIVIVTVIFFSVTIRYRADLLAEAADHEGANINASIGGTIDSTHR